MVPQRILNLSLLKKLSTTSFPERPLLFNSTRCSGAISSKIDARISRRCFSTVIADSETNDVDDVDDVITRLRRLQYKRKMKETRKKVFKNKGISKAEQEELFSRFSKALKWFQTKYGHLNIPKDYQLPTSNEEGLDEDIKGYSVGITVINIRSHAYFTTASCKPKLIELGILPEPSPVSDKLSQFTYIGSHYIDMLYIDECNVTLFFIFTLSFFYLLSFFTSTMFTLLLTLKVHCMRLKLTMATLTLLWATRSTPAVEMDISMQGLQVWKERHWVRYWQISRSGVCISLDLIYMSDGDLLVLG
jgi:hypothetical protein